MTTAQYKARWTKEATAQFNRDVAHMKKNKVPFMVGHAPKKAPAAKSVHLAQYAPRNMTAGVMFTVADETRSGALTGMRKLLLEFAKQEGIKRNWFAPDEIVVRELVLGAGYVAHAMLTKPKVGV